MAISAITANPPFYRAFPVADSTESVTVKIMNNYVTITEPFIGFWNLTHNIACEINRIEYECASENEYHASLSKADSEGSSIDITISKDGYVKVNELPFTATLTSKYGTYCIDTCHDEERYGNSRKITIHKENSDNTLSLIYINNKIPIPVSTTVSIPVSTISTSFSSSDVKVSSVVLTQYNELNSRIRELKKQIDSIHDDEKNITEEEVRSLSNTIEQHEIDIIEYEKMIAEEKSERKLERYRESIQQYKRNLEIYVPRKIRYETFLKTFQVRLDTCRKQLEECKGELDGLKKTYPAFLNREKVQANIGHIYENMCLDNIRSEATKELSYGDKSLPKTRELIYDFKNYSMVSAVVCFTCPSDPIELIKYIAPINNLIQLRLILKNNLGVWQAFAKEANVMYGSMPCFRSYFKEKKEVILKAIEICRETGYDNKVDHIEPIAKELGYW
jgi:hypothetical protein